MCSANTTLNDSASAMLKASVSKRMNPSPQLSRDFFNRPTLLVSRELIGCRLVKHEVDTRISGVIVETEAYIGQEDLACHARSGKTDRNRSMWGPPGHAYVYFTYGMHWMFNIVTEEAGTPAAVLVRALIPAEGLDIVQQRRSGQPYKRLMDGPAKLCQGLAIDGDLDGIDLCAPGSQLQLEEYGSLPDSSVSTGPRVGLNNVLEPWKSMPWRFLALPEAYQTAMEVSPL